MSSSSIIVSGALIAVGATFGRATLHKFAIWKEPDDHPILAMSRFTRAYPRWSLVLASTAEIAGIALLLAASTWGVVVLLSLLAVYTIGVARLGADQSCGCFSSAPEPNRGSALKRNALLFVALSASLIALGSGVSFRPTAAASLALATLLLAPVFGRVALDWLAASLRPRGGARVPGA